MPKVPVLTTEIVDKFICLGKAHASDELLFNDLLSELSKYGYTNRLNRNYWELYSKPLSASEIVWLIKGLTLAETHYHWAGGSVGAVSWVFRQLKDRTSDKIIEEVIKWVFEHRWNYWIPFGTSRYSSYEDYLWKNSEEYAEIRYKRRMKHEAKEKEQCEKAKKRRIEKARISLEHKQRTNNRAQQRQKVICELAKMKPQDRWKEIASNESVSIEYYPSEWADESEGILRELSFKTRIALIERISYKRKGAWRNLRKVLTRIENETLKKGDKEK